jgi:O-antigen/teichoic acid export membrane protein
LAAAAALGIVMAHYGRPQFDSLMILSRLTEGFGFSLAGSTQSAYNDIDNVLLSHYGMNISNGLYTMAYRIVDIATIPITALDLAALLRYSRQSQKGVNRVVRLSLRLAKRATLLGIIMLSCFFRITTYTVHRQHWI